MSPSVPRSFKYGRSVGVVAIRILTRLRKRQNNDSEEIGGGKTYLTQISLEQVEEVWLAQPYLFCEEEDSEKGMFGSSRQT